MEPQVGKFRSARCVAAFAGALLALAACSKQGGDAASAAQAVAPGEGLAEVVAGAHRSEANRARDVYRHPVETLTFFGIRPDMTVVELWPFGGWYTEILAPYLRVRRLEFHELPKTISGKIRRVELRARENDPSADLSGEFREEHFPNLKKAR